MSGVIENEANIWMHPPRDALFEILELNPFPYVKFPLQIGTKWNWQLEIGSNWGDERWITWDGRITNSYEYVIEDEKLLETSFGELVCFEIYSVAQSRLGKTSLRSWFNEEYGFVRMNYTNIDGSTLNLELVEMDNSLQMTPNLNSN